MNRKFAYLLPSLFIALTSLSCESSEERREEAQAKKLEADAALTREQAKQVSKGTPVPAAYVEVAVAPTPPPPTPEQQPPSPGQTYVWVPGYQAWNNGTWTWTPGQWTLPPQPAAQWVPAHWEKYGNGWLWVEGRWR
jgi:WXXGXW repeat (2 copies)